MSKRDDRVSLKDMLDHAREAVTLLGDTSREDFHEQRVLQLALILAKQAEAGRRGFFFPQET